MVKDEFESSYKKAFENDLLSGDAAVMEKLDNAVGASHEYFKMFKGGKGDAAGKAVESWLANDIPSEKIAGAFFNTKNAGLRTNAVPVMRKLKQIHGGESTEFKAVQDMALQGIMGGRNKDTLRTALRDSLEHGGTFLNETFTKRQLSFMKRSLDYLDGIALEGKKGRSSGSAERAFRWLNAASSQEAAFSGIINRFKQVAATLTGNESKYFKAPVQQLAVNPATGLGAQGAVNYSNQ